MSITPYTPTQNKGITPYVPGVSYSDQINKPAPERNILQKGAGLLLDPVVKLATEGGQLLGKGIVKGVEAFQSPEQKAKTETKLQGALNTPVTVPGLGTPVKPLNEVGVKDVAGQALGTAGLFTGNPMLGGALLMGGNKLEEGGSASDVFYSGLGGAIFGKIADLGFEKVAPYIGKQLEKYGLPLWDKIESKIPEAVKGTYKALIEKAPLESVKVPNAPQGNFVNIGLQTNVGGTITDKDIIKALPKDVKIISSATHPSGTEPTFVGQLSRPLTQEEHYALTKTLKQDAIPQMVNGKGTMTNVGQKNWGNFNPEYFMDLTGKPLGATPKVSTPFDKYQAGAEEIDKKVSGTIKNATDKFGITTPELTADQKIAETIAPKPTPKEAKMAETQGRLYKGKEQTLFKGETADKIATSDEQLRQVQTIKNNIPGAEKMDEPTLYDTLKDKINGVAGKLKPELEKTPTKFETVKKMQDDLKTIEDKLFSNAPATEEKNVLKRKAQFEAIVKKVSSKSKGNLNDLWNVAKEYDNTIPETVKRANDMSSESLQAQKTEWLQRRSIFKTALNDSKNGLGETSRKAFSDMTDMYGAQQGILSKAEVNTTLKGSKVSEFNKSTGGKLLKGAIGGTTLYEGAKALGVPLP